MVASLQLIIIRWYFSGLIFNCLFVNKQNAYFSDVSLRDSMICFAPSFTTDDPLSHDI